MQLEIVPFRAAHLDEAAALLARRHQEDCVFESALPERFSQVEVARAAVEATLSKPEANGMVALQSGRMIGYLIGVPQINLIWGRSVWVPLAGHAVDRTCGAEVYRDLYAALSPSWVAHGCFAHYALIPASDRPALDAWFALSFGKEHAHGIRETADASALNPPIDPTLTIRRAELTDLDASIELDSVIPGHQSRSPVYAPYWFEEYAPFGNKEAIRQESLEFLQDESVKLWLAIRNGQLVAYQLFMPAFPHFDRVDNMMIPDQCSFLGTAATREEEQGRGVGRALTAHGLAADHAAGYTYCLTDWRVTNLLSSRFWPRQGFQPVAYRLSRRLDERIAWAHRDPSPSPWLSRAFSIFPTPPENT